MLWLVGETLRCLREESIHTMLHTSTFFLFIIIYVFYSYTCR